MIVKENSIESTKNRDYSQLLEYSYLRSRIDCASRLEYLSDEIFNFTTYDSEISELFATKAIEVCEAINNKLTHDYIENQENYKWYLLMVNMPFFSDRINWGTSIRGAWWEPESPHSDFNSCGLYDEEGQITEDMIFDRDTWTKFIAAVIAFGREKEQE